MNFQGIGNLGFFIVYEFFLVGFIVIGLICFFFINFIFVYFDSVIVYKVDFGFFDFFKDVFLGQDVVVFVVGSLGVLVQRLVVDVVIVVGVKRFILSEFGVNMWKVRDRLMGVILRGKVEVVDYLIEREREIEWMGVSMGLFFDWVSFFI